MNAVNRFHHEQFPVGGLLRRDRSVSVCVPTRGCEATIGGVVQTLVDLRERGLVDEVVVIDAGTDATATIARDLGADVFHENDVLSQLGPAIGKGDAMWRGVSVCRSDVICFVDGDTRGFGAHFVSGVVGPVLEDRASFVKGAFRRPFTTPDGAVTDRGGGRVTELTARPLLRAFFPELAWLTQPLAGEMAAPRTLLNAIPFSVGYAVETALLLDVYARLGASAIAETDLDVRHNAHQSLEALSAMADEVLGAVLARVPGVTPLEAVVPEQRPPLADAEEWHCGAAQPRLDLRV